MFGFKGKKYNLLMQYIGIVAEVQVAVGQQKTINRCFEEEINKLKTKMALMPTDRTVAPETDAEKYVRFNKNAKALCEGMIENLTELKNILLNMQRG